MTRIRLNTQQAREVAQRLCAEADALDRMTNSLNHAIGSLDTWAWDGRSRARAESHLNRVAPSGRDAAQMLEDLGRKLRHVADTFEREDATASRNLEGMSWVEWDRDRSEPANDRVAVIARNRRQIQENWDAMNLDERKLWLANWYNEICKKLGIKPVNFRIRDLDDPKGQDARGVYNSGFIGLFASLSIDVDNVKGDDPFVVMETVVHETRHQYQHYLVEHPDERPDGISKEQIETWKRNFNNYKKAKDDFEAYRKQPVEQDARDFASQSVDSYIESGEVTI
ncbi:MAG: hypothetical protein BWY63_01075 [Chloroflexi bacterium ADurb.Bin360]|nr:MAG: hypothetical protein BWY63_01075 [Chloroflexi bacterium ADurb.Bin360]